MDNLTNIKNKAIEIKDKTIEQLRKLVIIIMDRKEIAIISGLSIILVILLTIVVIPNTRRAIRIKESTSLITNSYEDVKNVESITYGQLDDTIRKEKKITVALVDPNDDYYEDFEASLKDSSKMSEYTGKLYLYPLIYDQKKMTDFYKLKAGITIIHFEDRQEIERTILDSSKEIELYLVDHLNSLIRPSGAELEQAEKEREEQEKAREAAQKAKDEEIIDELKDTPADDSAAR